MALVQEKKLVVREVEELSFQEIESNVSDDSVRSF